MTEQEALEVARKQIRAENAAYMREWRKRNPEKDRAIRNRYREKLKAKRQSGRDATAAGNRRAQSLANCRAATAVKARVFAP